MIRRYYPVHIIALVMGLVCMGSELYANIETMYEKTRTLFDSTIASTFVVFLAGAFALTIAKVAFQQRAFFTSLMLGVGFIVTTTFVSTTTLDRTSSQRDNYLSAIWEADEQYQQLIKIKKDVTYMASRTCSTNRKSDACTKIEGEVTIANERLRRRQAELDSMGVRLAAMIPGVTPEMASVWQPTLLPFALLILSNFLFSFGAAGKYEKVNKIQLGEQESIELKAERWAADYHTQFGRMPKPAEIARGTGCTYYVGQKVLARLN